MKSKYIILYADEFDTDIWCRYMDILDLSHAEIVVKISIKDITILTDESF